MGLVSPAAAGSPATGTGLQPIVILGVQREDGQLQIMLDPPELGRLTVALEPGDQGVRAIVTAERALTGELARRHAEILLSGLREAGIDAASVEVGDTGSGQDQRSDHAPGHGAAARSAVAQAGPDEGGGSVESAMTPAEGSGSHALDRRV